MTGDPRRDQPGAVRFEPAWLAGIIAFGIAVRLWSFVGIVRLDSIRYMEVANHVLGGGSLFDQNVFYASSRLAIFGPLLLLSRLLGWAEPVATAWPLACSVLAIAGTWIIGRELFDGRVGLLAAFAMACLPLEIELATQLLPDPIEGAFIVLAVAFAVLAITRERGWRRWAVSAGVALGVAYFARVNAIIFLPGVLAVGAIIEPRKWKRSLWALVGLGGVLAGAAIVFFLLSGDPLIDWHRTGSFLAAYTESGFVFRGQRFWRQFFSLGPFMPAMLMLGAGTVWVLIERRRGAWLLLAWAYGFWFYLDLVSPLHGLDTSYRYAEPMMAPIAILFACGVVWLCDRFARRGASAVAALAVVCLLAMVPVGRAVALKWRNVPSWQALRTAAAEVTRSGDRSPIITDAKFADIAMNYYTGFRLGRDTLAPPSDPRNRGSRLWLRSERALVPGERTWWVSAEEPTTGDATTVVMRYTGPDGLAVGVYLIHP